MFIPEVIEEAMVLSDVGVDKCKLYAKRSIVDMESRPPKGMVGKGRVENGKQVYEIGGIR